MNLAKREFKSGDSGGGTMKTLLAFLLLLGSASAVEIFVSASGSGTACSSASPCSVSQGISNFPSGGCGTIHYASGNYSSGLDITKSGGSTSCRMVLQCDAGTASALVAKGKCNIGHGTSGGVALLLEGQFIDVIGFDIGSNPNMNVAVDFTKSNTRVIGNYIHDLAANVNANGNGLGCIDAGAINGVTNLGAPSTGTFILRNFIVNVGLGTQISPSGNCNWGIDTDANNTTQDNIIINTTSGGIASHGGCNLIWTNNVVINTFDAFVPNAQNESSECVGGHRGLNTIANNYSASVNKHYFQSGGAPDCVTGRPTLYSHNITDGSGTLYSPARTGCDTVSNAPTSVQAGASFFVNYQTNGSGDYHLNSSSAGIRAGSSPTTCVSGGTSPCTPPADFEGTTRPNPPSVSAYDVTSASIQPPTGLTATVN